MHFKRYIVSLCIYRIDIYRYRYMYTLFSLLVHVCMYVCMYVCTYSGIHAGICLQRFMVAHTGFVVCKDDIRRHVTIMNY